MVRSVRCLMRWYLSVRRLSEWQLSRWSCCISRLKHHRLKKCGLKLNTFLLEWRNVKLGLSLLIATLRVYSTLHFSYLGLFLYPRMCLSLSPGLCWWSLYSPNLRNIKGFLKFHPPHRLIIIRVINVRALKIYLSTQINVSILEHSSEEATIGEYACLALTTWDYMHHHHVPQVDSSPSQNWVNEEYLIIRYLVSIFVSW